MKGEMFSQSMSTDLSLDYRENITSQPEQQIPPLSSQSCRKTAPPSCPNWSVAPHTHFLH